MINISAHIIAQLPLTEGNGDNRNLLNNFDVPFVPEEFKSSPKRIIFDKNDFVSLLPSSDLRGPLTEAILTVLVSTRSSSNDTGVCILLSTEMPLGFQIRVGKQYCGGHNLG